MGRGAEDPEKLTRAQLWLEVNLSTPAWAGSIFFFFPKQSSVWARGRTDLWDQKMIQAFERNCATAFEPAVGILTLVMIKAARAHFRRSESSERKNLNQGSPVQFDLWRVILHLRKRAEAKKWACVFGLVMTHDDWNLIYWQSISYNHGFHLPVVCNFCNYHIVKRSFELVWGSLCKKVQMHKLADIINIKLR